MTHRILVAIDDSPDALAATRLAVGLARDLGASLRAVHVVSNHGVDAALSSPGGTPMGVRRGQARAALLARVTAIAAAEGVVVETVLVTGRVGAELLVAARGWDAELLVIGKSGRPVVGDPYVGSLTRHVLEFAEQPVVVVPAATPRR